MTTALAPSVTKWEEIERDLRSRYDTRHYPDVGAVGDYAFKDFLKRARLLATEKGAKKALEFELLIQTGGTEDLPIREWRARALLEGKELVRLTCPLPTRLDVLTGLVSTPDRITNKDWQLKLADTQFVMREGKFVSTAIVILDTTFV